MFFYNHSKFTFVPTVVKKENAKTFQGLPTLIFKD